MVHELSYLVTLRQSYSLTSILIFQANVKWDGGYGARPPRLVSSSHGELLEMDMLFWHGQNLQILDGLVH